MAKFVNSKDTCSTYPTSQGTLGIPYSQDEELENIQRKFEQLATFVNKLVEYIPKLYEIDVTVEKFLSFHEVCTKSIYLNLSCHEWNVPIQSANEIEIKTDLACSTKHTKTRTKSTTFERTFQIIVDSLPKQFRTKKDHMEKLEKIIHCLYIHKDKYLTTQEISSKMDMSSVHSTVYLNILHKAGKVC